jgi:hypothetical protein
MTTLSFPAIFYRASHIIGRQASGGFDTWGKRRWVLHSFLLYIQGLGVSGLIFPLSFFVYRDLHLHSCICTYGDGIGYYFI